jgi:hypothetical protein
VRRRGTQYWARLQFGSGSQRSGSGVVGVVRRGRARCGVIIVVGIVVVRRRCRGGTHIGAVGRSWRAGHSPSASSSSAKQRADGPVDKGRISSFRREPQRVRWERPRTTGARLGLGDDTGTLDWARRRERISESAKVDRNAALLALCACRAMGTFKACACRLKQPLFDWTCLAFVMCLRTQFSIQISCKPPHEHAKNPIQELVYFSCCCPPSFRTRVHNCAILHCYGCSDWNPPSVQHLQHSASTVRCLLT